MRASVIINNYNYGRFLRQCVLSATAQDYRDLEIVVVDDGSTDNSREILAEFGPAISVIEQANSGQLCAILAGLSCCSGDYVFLLDSDDYWPPGYVSSVVAAIERNDGPDLVFSGIISVDNQGVERRAGALRSKDVDYGYSYLISRYVAQWVGDITSTIAIKTRVLSTILQRSRPLADRYRINADDAIVVGADLLGFRKVFVAGADIYYRSHSDNAWRNTTLSAGRQHQIFIRKCMLFALLDDTGKANPWLGFGLPFAVEFETKSNVPFAEAARYVRAVLRYGESRRLAQAWRILSHWRAAGTTNNGLLRLLQRAR